MNLIFNYTSKGICFQDTATPQMEGLIELHDNIMYYLFIILFAVFWIIVSIVRNYLYDKISSKYVNHKTLIKLIWTISPAIILILIAFPSFKLLCLMDEVTDLSFTLSISENQLCWSHEYTDFSLQNEDEIVYDSYLIPESYLEEGKLRMLEVDNRVIVPEDIHTRFIVSSGNVTDTLFMEEASKGPSGSTGSILVEGVNALSRPLADWRWFPMEHGDLYTESWGFNNHIKRNGSIIIYNKSDPSDDITWVMAGDNHHGVKYIIDTHYPGTIKHNMGTQKGSSLDPKLVKIDISKFLDYTATHHTTSNGSLIIPDDNGYISIQRG